VAVVTCVTFPLGMVDIGATLKQQKKRIALLKEVATSR